MFSDSFALVCPPILGGFHCKSEEVIVESLMQVLTLFHLRALFFSPPPLEKAFFGNNICFPFCTFLDSVKDLF